MIVSSRTPGWTAPQTHYARSGDAYIAYQVVGDGPVDLVLVAELLSHSEHRWDEPKLARSLRRLASFTRLIQFDRRGTGLSDPVPLDRLPTLEQRMADLSAVLDAVGAPRPVVLGFGEGGVESILYAASHPERVSSLVVYGAWPRFYADEEYPVGWHPDVLETLIEAVTAAWGQGGLAAHVAPSLADDERFRNWLAAWERLAATPGTAAALMRIALSVDIRHVLPSVRVPTLVVHRTDDHFSPVAHGRYLAGHIPGAELVELPGVDHPFFVGDSDAVIDEIEAFVTGNRPLPKVDRVLATVLFVDIVGSTQQAVALGDSGWRDRLEAYLAMARRQLDRFAGQEIDTAGDGLFASFDGPARAVTCATAIREAAGRMGIEVRAG
ncbi:MAG TPA: alpha/beta fold hydrolase, partial [Acidimicrobiales bacterium]|nr:alpha/beta fold hydrolase [Acidimicrobiales bacterium]